MRKINPMLVKAAEDVTQSELNHAPELPTLIALDATLLATIDLFHFFYPYVGDPWAEVETGGIDRILEDKIAESIANSAITLRKKLSAYYATVKANCSKPSEQKEVFF